MTKKSLILLITLILTTFNLYTQVAWIEPSDATVDSTVTVYFDATEGNQGLMDYTGDVYAHTGVITMESTNDSDWKHVVAEWGTADENVLMEQINSNLYKISFNIRNFYNIEPDEIVLKLAFVFRNADGSVTGRSEDGSDIFVPVQNENNWEYETFSNSTDGLQILTSNGRIRFRLYNNALETQFIPDSAESPGSYSIKADPLAEKFTIDTSDTSIEAEWESWQLTINKASLSIQYFYNDSLLEMTDFMSGGAAQGGILTFDVGNQTHFYGGGSRALPFNLHGFNIDFYNQAHYGYSNQTSNLNISIPLLTSPEGYSLLFDNRYYSSAEIGSDNTSEINYQTSKGPLRYFLIGGNNMRELSKAQADLTGHAPMPPMWGLGYIQSRYGYETREEAEQIVEEMRSNNFAMDALVLDLYWFGGTSGMGNFDWDTGAFPEPGQMIQNFKDKGVETILITEPYFTLESNLYDEASSKGHFAENENGEPYVLSGFWAGDASLLDMSSQDARSWLWPYYQSLFEQGVAGLWTDLGEPESHPDDMIHKMGQANDVHNIYNNLWAKMLHENVKETYPDKRLFNLTRSGYTSMQSYSTYPWSGDIQRSFSGLQAQIPIMLHMSMSGEGYMHSDIGGFTGGGQDPELYTRWMQLGAFSPIMRAHGTGVPPEPVFYNDETQDIVRDAIDLRYDFLPYNYTLSWQYSKEGIPPMRPMNYYQNQSEKLSAISDQYFWGKDLIVAPVINENTSSRMVTLPGDRLWADYYSGKLYEGDITTSIEAPIDRIPLFVREGGFIVESREQLTHTKNYNSDSIRIRHVLPSEEVTGESVWYHDDGSTAGNINENRYNLIKFTSNTEGKLSTITLEKDKDNIESPERQIEFMLYGLSDIPGRITLNDNELPLYTSRESYDTSKKAGYWNDSFLYVHFQWKDTLAKVKIDREETGTLVHDSRSAKLNLTVNPNPFTKQAQMQTYVERKGVYRLTLYYIDGRIAGTAEYKLNSGRHQAFLSEIVSQPQSLPEGVYVLEFKGNYGKTQTRLIKVD